MNTPEKREAPSSMVGLLEGVFQNARARLTAMEVVQREGLHPSPRPTVEVPTPLSKWQKRVNVVVHSEIRNSFAETG